MPIEIKELHIRVNVSPPDAGQKMSGHAQGPGRGTAIANSEKQEIIAECVDQVMRILEGKKER